ncbi:antibiotic biosynthesis monooxygenase family protein [Vibrio sp. HN007]|uniref:antibiotic biosynthesis monooxygenase family protein n=1 Tax=Vibrio iocasae TaxID=3098914 RepID=UPI0035D4F3EC
MRIINLVATSILMSGVLLLNLAHANQGQVNHDNNSAVTLINPFIVPVNKLDETIAMWEKARDFLQQQPGYISTELHQAISTDSEYQLINVAKWKSAKEFKAATKKMHASGEIPKIDGVKYRPGLYKVIRKD